MFPWTAVAVIGGIALLWNGMIWRALVLNITEVDVFHVLLQLPFAAAGVVLAYLAAAMLLNRTHVEIGDEMLSIRHGPLKLPSVSRTWLHVADIRRVYVGQEWDRSEPYALIAEVAGGNRKLLLPGLHRLEHAAYLARRIAARLDRASGGRVQTR